MKILMMMHFMLVLNRPFALILSQVSRKLEKTSVGSALPVLCQFVQQQHRTIKSKSFCCIRDDADAIDPNNLAAFVQCFPRINTEQWQQLGVLCDKIKDWNSRINVISRKDIDSVVSHHLIPSLCVSLVRPFEVGDTIIDVGTGGGFPGLPLAIAHPSVQFTLLDSSGVKMKVVEDIVTSMGLRNVKVVTMRAEQYTEKHTFVLGRAVKAIPTFLEYSSHLLNYTAAASHGSTGVSSSSSARSDEVVSGLLYIKGGDFQEELQAAGIRQYSLNRIADLVPVHIKDSEKFVLHVPTIELRRYHEGKLARQQQDVQTTRRSTDKSSGQKTRRK